MSEKTDRFRRAAIWSAIVLVAAGGIIGAIGRSWLTVALAVLCLANSVWLLERTRQTRVNR